MKKLIVIVVVSIFSLAVNAAPVTWTLNDVHFDDGGTAVGSYDYDAVANIYSNVFITTTEGSIFSGSSYNDACNVSTCHPDFIDSRPVFENVTGTYIERLLVFSLQGAMTNSGGVLQILAGGIGCELSCEVDDALRSRIVVAGSVSAVPVPAAAWLFGSALAVLGWLRRQQLV